MNVMSPLLQDSSHEAAADPVQADELQRARAELVERDDLLAIVAHELRNPLHALSLQLALARSTAESANPGDTAARIAKVQATLARYSDRVTVLLELARLNADAYPLTRKPVDLCSVLRAVAESLSNEAQQRGVVVCLDLPPACAAFTDATVVEQIVDNLLLNAFKHAACRSVAVVLHASPGGWAQIDVADDGRGIDVQDQQRIFSRFGVAQSSARGRGTGLGLWIVRKLLAVLGGSVILHSEPGVGSTFSVRFPLGASPDPAT